MSDRFAKYLAVTLGCKVNQYETEYLCQGLELLGYRAARPGEPADLCVVNTCTVTVEADHKSRKAIRQLARQNPQAKLIVMGCYATRASEELAVMPGVWEVVADKRQLPQLLVRLGLEVAPSGIWRFGDRKRAYVKIQDGCNMPCSYCIIPKVRPVLMSRRPDDVLQEISRLAATGHREIVLTGIHLGLYGAEFGRRAVHAPQQPDTSASSDFARPPDVAPVPVVAQLPNLCTLLRQIVALPGRFRVRLSSLEASEVTDELLTIMRDNPQRICQHLHLSMQSGSDAVLRRMRRPWPAGRFVERCLHIRERLPGAALTADVIVGFPGETEDDFAATCQAVEQIGFAKLHVFRYSPRPGTAAAELPHQVAEPIKRQRAERLIALGRHLRRKYMSSLLGQRLEVLVEQSLAPCEVANQKLCATAVCGSNAGLCPRHEAPNRLIPQPTLLDQKTEAKAAITTAAATDVLLGTASQYVPVELCGPSDWVGQLVEATACDVQGDRLRALVDPAIHPGERLHKGT